MLGIVWDGHQFLVGGGDGTILSSPDGVTWITRHSGEPVSFYSFASSGTNYVAVGNDGIFTSPDSITWAAARNAPKSVPFTGCAWTGSRFVACGLGFDKNATLYTSPDGETWTLSGKEFTASFRAAIAHGSDVYVAGDSVVAKSSDGGKTWADIFNQPGNNKLFMGLATDGQSLIAVGFNHNVWALPLGLRK